MGNNNWITSASKNGYKFIFKCSQFCTVSGIGCFFLSSNDILYETNRFILVRFVIVFDYLNNNHNVIVVALFEDDSFLVDVVVAFIARFGIIDSFG